MFAINTMFDARSDVGRKGVEGMTLAALGWPEAIVWVAVILGVSLVASVLVWSIFRTGQTAIRSERAATEAD